MHVVIQACSAADRRVRRAEPFFQHLPARRVAECVGVSPRFAVAQIAAEAAQSARVVIAVADGAIRWTGLAQHSTGAAIEAENPPFKACLCAQALFVMLTPIFRWYLSL